MDYSKRVEIERLRALRSALTTFSGGSFILACASCIFSDSLSVSPELSTFLFGIVGLASYCKSIECSDRISLLESESSKTIKKVFKLGVSLDRNKNLTNS